MKLHVRTKLSLTFFFVDKNETGVNWGERLWSVIDKREKTNNEKYQMCLEIGYVFTQIFLPKDTSANLK